MPPQFATSAEPLNHVADIDGIEAAGPHSVAIAHAGGNVLGGIFRDFVGHIGTGAGRHGGIDRRIARDGEDLAYIPASALRSLWRDAAETLASGLDDGARGGWHDLVHSIFGSKRQASTRVRASGL